MRSKLRYHFLSFVMPIDKYHCKQEIVLLPVNSKTFSHTAGERR